MTFRNLLPAITLLLGLVLGVIGSRSFWSPKDASRQEFEPLTKSATNPADASTTAGTLPQNQEASTSSSPPFTGTVDSLLALVPSAYSSDPTLQFLSAVEGLTEDQAARLFLESQSSPLRSLRKTMAQKALIRRWAQWNPEAAYSAAQTFNGRSSSHTLSHIVAREMASQDPDKAIAFAESIEGKGKKKQFSEAIATTLAEKDPERALSLLSKYANQSNYYYAIRVYETWVQQDPNAAIASAANIANPRMRADVQENLVSYLTPEDPERAWSYALGLKGGARTASLEKVLFRVARHDPQMALTFLHEIPKGMKKKDALDNLFRGWAEKDADEAQAWVLSLPKDEQAEVLRENLSSIPIADAIPLLEKLPKTSETPSLYYQAVNRLVDIDPQAAQKWVQQLPLGPTRESAAKALLAGLTRSHPAQAASFLEDESVNLASSSAVSQIAANWALTDSDAAFTWLASLHGAPAVHQSLTMRTVSELTEKSPSEAASYTLSIQDEELRQMAIESFARTWSKQDLESAQNWVANNLEESERIGAYQAILDQTIDSEPTQAAKVLEQASQGLTQEEAKERFGNSKIALASYWARVDPGAAVAWAQTQNDTEQRPKILANIVNEWAGFDTTAAANFVLTLPEGTERDSSIASLVHQLNRWDPESAFLWAESSSDNEARQEMIQSTIEAWTRSDPDAARQALEGAHLSEEKRARLLENFD